VQAEDFTRFRAVITGMAKLYERELDGTLLDAYWLAMRDWTLPDFEAAAQQLMGRAKFMPRPADFNELRNATRVTSGEAWALALEHVRKGHHRDGPKAPADVDRAVRAIGGWQIIGQATDEDLRFLERRFTANYSEIREATDIREELPLLPRDHPVMALLAGMRRK
jgi:hypothetical protein